MPRTNDSRERTVRAAAALISSRGVAGTGLREVVTSAGTPRGSLSHHFPGGKDELVVEAVLWTAGRLEARLRTLAEADPPATLADVLRLSTTWWEKGLLAVDFTGGCAVAATVMDAAVQDIDVRNAVSRAFQSWLDPIARIAAGDGVPAPLDRQFAVMTVASIEGALLLCRANASLEPLHDVEASLLRLADALRGATT